VIEPLVERKDSLPLLYDTDLMLGSGHVSGYAVNDPAAEAGVVAGLRALAEPGAFRARYGVGEKGVFSSPEVGTIAGFANHLGNTLAHVAWHPTLRIGRDRNVHDAVDFAHPPCCSDLADPQASMQAFFDGQVSFQPVETFQEMVAVVKTARGSSQAVGMVGRQGRAVVSIHRPVSNLPVGSLQAFLDEWLKQGGAEKIDYVHGDEVVDRVGTQPNLGFTCRRAKTDLFKTVIGRRAAEEDLLMGEARDKRFTWKLPIA
jgi:hypothetical protein